MSGTGATASLSYAILGIDWSLSTAIGRAWVGSGATLTFGHGCAPPWSRATKRLSTNRRCSPSRSNGSVAPLGRCWLTIYRYESLHEDFARLCQRLGVDAALPHRKASAHRHYTAYYDAETRDVVHARFQRDVEYFEYRFHK